MHPSTRPTLVVFTLGPRAESSRHPLVPGKLRSAEVDLRRACFEAALDAGRSAGCVLEVCSPKPPRHLGGAVWRPQGGGSFEARLGRALEAARGGPAAIVGTDVPGLDAGHVRRALELLEEDPDRVVLGPSPDGGIYLLAAARPVAQHLSAVPWQSRRTLAALHHALETAGRPVAMLEPLADLDRPADLECWLAGPSRPATLHPSTRALRRLLAVYRRPVEAPRRDPGTLCPRPLPSPRGPPSVLAV